MTFPSPWHNRAIPPFPITLTQEDGERIIAALIERLSPVDVEDRVLADKIKKAMRFARTARRGPAGYPAKDGKK